MVVSFKNTAKVNPRAANDVRNIGKLTNHFTNPFVSRSLNCIPQYTNAQKEVAIDRVNIILSER